MKFGVREICDVVLRAKSAMKIGNKIFYKNEPVLYFDTLKTSALENATNTVYAQGGRGNARLIAWEGEKTITFTMEDALISPMGLSVLTGAGLVKAEEKSIIVHKTEITNKVENIGPGFPNNVGVRITLENKPYVNKDNIKSEDYIYVMLLDEKGEVCSEPYIASETEEQLLNNKQISIYKNEETAPSYSDDNKRKNDLSKFYKNCSVLVDYYTEVTEKAYQVNITPEDFSGNFYLEASTLFRASNGVDMPAEFIIPNCKIQSNFTFTMASSGDPTTFNFVIDAFPDYTRWNKDKKVFAAIQVIEQNEITSNLERLGTPHNYKSDEDYNPFLTYKKEQEQYITDEPEELLNDIFTSIDKNGNIYNDVGYKKNYLLNYNGSYYDDSSQNGDGYTITGYIPFQYGQNLNIIGFNLEDSSTSSYQGIYIYTDFSRNITGNRFVVLDKKEISYSLEDYQNLQGDQNISVFTPGIKYIRVCFHNTNLSEMAVLVSGNPISLEEESNNNLQSLSFSPNLSLQSNNDEEESISPEEEVSNLVNEDLDISDIISLLEEEEEE